MTEKEETLEEFLWEELEPKKQKFDIQAYLDQHEAFKKKWLQLIDEDLFNWLGLQDIMMTEASNLKSMYYEQKLEIDRDKALRTLELKAEKDENWKWYTEKWIEALIKKEFFEKDLEQNVLKTTYELLIQKASTIVEYINIVKMNKKSNFSI